MRLFYPAKFLLKVFSIFFNPTERAVSTFLLTLSSLFVAIIGDMGDGVFGKAWVTSGVGGDDLEFEIGAILGGGE